MSLRFVLASVVPVIAACCICVLFSARCASSQAFDGSVEVEEPGCCDLTNAHGQRKHIVLVSTMDGYMHALDSNDGGALLWSLPTGPDSLLAGSLGNLHLSSGELTYRVIPTLDGHLYVYDAGNSLHPLHFDIERLLTTSTRFGADVVAGGKEVLTHGVSLLTGDLRYTCDALGCERNAAMIGAHAVGPTVVIRRISQTVRAVHAISGDERWNVTIAEHQVQLATEDVSPGAEPAHATTIQLRPSSGTVVALNSRGNVLWNREFGQPIAQGWQYRENANALDELSIFDSQIVPHLDDLEADDNVQLESLMYLGSYKGDAYIVLSSGERRRLRSLIASKHLSMHMPTFQAPPIDMYQVDKTAHAEGGASDSDTAMAQFYEESLKLNADSDVASFLSSMEVMSQEPCADGGSCNSHEPNSCAANEAGSLSSAEDNPLEAPGWYLYQHRRQQVPHPGAGSALVQFSRWPNKLRKYFLPNRLKSTIKARADGALEVSREDPEQFWWLLSLCVLSLCGLSAVVSASCMRCYQRRHYKQRLRQISHLSAQDISSSSRRSSSRSLSLQVDLANDLALPTAAVKSAMSQASFPGSQISADSEASEYDSRFVSDFEPIRCLGRGGFGVVFQCRNRYDECQYAIKRATVPNSATSREKVLREVRALARLDHRRIVRYYNCWLETPPAKWQRDCDKRLMELWLNFRLKDRTECAWQIAKYNFNDFLVIKISAAQSHDLTGGVTSAEHLGTTNPTSISGPPAVLRQRKGHLKQFHGAHQLSGETLGDSSVDSTGTDKQLPGFYAAGGDSGNPNEDQSESIVFAESTNDRKQKQGSRSELHQTGDCGDATSNSGANQVRRVNVQAQTSPQVMYLYIQMQLCSALTLSHWLRTAAKFGTNLTDGRVRAGLLSWFKQTVDAVAYVHSQGLMHRDLKPSNIFFEFNGRGVRVGDFGLATAWQAQQHMLGLVDEHVDHVQDRQQNGPDLTGSRSSGSQLTDNVGTRLYMSPELASSRISQYMFKQYSEELDNSNYTNKVDVYSLGLILAELLAGFQTHMERVQSLESIRRIGKKENDPVLRSVKDTLGCDWTHVCWLTNPEPNKRPSCDEILACEELFERADQVVADEMGAEFVIAHTNGIEQRKTV